MRRTSHGRRHGLRHHLRHGLRHARRRWRRDGPGGRSPRAVVSVGALALGLGVVWLAVTGLIARSQLADLESRLHQVRTLLAAGRIGDARTLAADIPAMAERAHRLTTGPAWFVAAHVPWAGAPVEVARATTTAAARVGAAAVPALLQVAADIDPDRLRSGGGTVRLQPLAASGPQLSGAAAVLERAMRDLHAAPTSTWLGAVDDGRAQFAAQLGAVRGYVSAAARACRVLPAMLGDSRPQRYFIGLQNEAELRGTGGLPGAFAIAVASHGTIRFTHFESDSAVLPARSHQQIATGLDFGGEYDALYGASQPTTSFVDSNVSPHFPYAAQIWAAMWQRTTGERIDGAIALDPTVLSYLLSVTGPAALPGGGVVSAQDVVPLTQSTSYALYPDTTRRKAFLVSILRAAAHRITDGTGQAVRLAQFGAYAAQQQRLLAWSRDPHVEALLEQTNYAGAIDADDPRPMSAVVLNNSAAGKLDYYLTRSEDYTRTGCGARRDVRVTIRLTNSAPATGLPRYVTARLDADPPAGVRPGDSRALLDYYATGGALLQSVTLNSRPTTASAQVERGHEVFRLDLELPRGTTQTVVLHLDEPAGHGAVRFWRQPGVNPLLVQSADQKCG